MYHVCTILSLRKREMVEGGEWSGGDLMQGWILRAILLKYASSFLFVFEPNMTLLMFIWKIDWFKIIFLKDDFSRENRLCERRLLIFYLFIICLKFFWNLEKHLKVVLIKEDFYINFFEITRESCLLQKTTFVQIFLKFEKTHERRLYQKSN